MSADSVHESVSLSRQAVGSPSLIAGKWAARIGCVANGVTPTKSSAAHATSSRQRTIVDGRRTSTASATAGAGSMPAM